MSQQPPQPPGWATPAPGSVPHPPPPQHPQGPGVWSAPVASGQSPSAVSSPAPRRGGSLAVWLAGSALVVAVLALVVALFALLGPFGPFGPFGPGADMGFDDDLGGTVPGAVSGQTLSGDRIGYSVVDALREVGAEVDPGAIECETLLRLDAGSTSDCHGTVGGDDSWSGWVEFTESPGEFILYED